MRHNRCIHTDCPAGSGVGMKLFLRKVPVMDDTAKNKILRRAVLLASVPACIAAMLLYRTPIREFISVMIAAEVEPVAKRRDTLLVDGPEKTFRRDVPKRFFADPE